jgi:hypothetical protein
MSDSLYFGPQIAARNRWAVEGRARVETLPARPRRERVRVAAVRTDVRTRVAAAAVLVGALVFALIAVLALRISSPAGRELLAPARSATTTLHVGGVPAAPGSAPAALGHTVAR